MRFEYLKRRDCPVCGGSRTDCRKSGDLIFCRTEHPSPSYKKIGHDAHFFGMFLHNDVAEEQSERRREEWFLQNRERRIATQQRNENNIKRSPSIPERNRAFTDAAFQLPLTQDDLADLRRRGFSEEDVKHYQFFSVTKKYQPLRYPSKNRSPGLDVSGKKLSNSCTGYYVPIFTPKGIISGSQLRANGTDGEDLDGNRYRWPKNRDYSSHLKEYIRDDDGNGELPLQFAKPRQLFDSVFSEYCCFAEGTLKPLVIAKFIGAIVIGASGANFAGATQQFREWVEAIGRKKGLLFPDAGSVANPAVMAQYQKLQSLCKINGIELSVAWWGQVCKETSVDADDLLNEGWSDLIEIISWKNFIDISNSIVHKNQREYNSLTEEQRIDRSVEIGTEKQLSYWIQAKYNEFLARQADRYGAGESNDDEVAPTPPEPIKDGAIVLYDRSNDGRLLRKYDGIIPLPEEWIEMGCPTIEYEHDERHESWRKSIAAGWSDILDRSSTGCGKSHDTGTITHEALGIDPKDRILLIAENYRNPTTESVERNFTPLPTRHDGLVEDPTQQTPLGRNHIRRPQKGEKPNIPANCPEARNFIDLEEKGLFVPGGKDSEICTRCPLFHSDSCSFLTERKAALEQTKIGCHLSQLGKLRSTDTGIIDETEKSLNSSRNVEVDVSAICGAMKQIEKNDPGLYHALLKPIGDAIVEMMFNPVDKKGNPKRHGFNHDEVIENLPSWQALMDSVWEDQADNFINAIDVWLFDGMKETKERIKDLLKNRVSEVLDGTRSPEEREAAIKNNIFLNWINPILTAIEKNEHYLRIADRKLTITFKSNKHRKTLENLKTRFYLDATYQRSDLAAQLDKDINDILPIREKLPNCSNLTVNIVKGFGRCGTQRETEGKYSQGERLVHLIKAIAAKDDSIGIIDFKSQLKEIPGVNAIQGWWWNHNRGSNIFKNLENLIAIGLPIPNLGQMAADFYALTGRHVRPDDKDDKEYQAFVQRKIDAEIIQLIGRGRAHLRPEEKVNVWIAADLTTDCITSIKENFPGATIRELDAYDICPDAAPKGVQRERGVMEAMMDFARRNITPRINDVAQAVGISQGRVSQIVSKFGGFKRLHKILVFLFEALYRETNISVPSDLEEDALYISNTYFSVLTSDRTGDGPVEAIEELATIYESFGEDKFKKILAAAPLWAIARLAGYVFALFGVNNTVRFPQAEDRILIPLVS